MSDKESVTSIQRSLDILTLDEKDQTVMEFVISGDWSKVRELVTNYGTEGKLSQKLVSCICSVCPPQSVIIAIKRAQSRSFAQKDEKLRNFAKTSWKKYICARKGEKLRNLSKTF